MDSSNSWLLSRVLVRLVAGALGGVVGYWLGLHLGYPVALGIALGAASVLALSISDTLKGHQLLDWLRNPEDPLPQLPGIWAEVAHRVQRVLHLRDDAIAHERARLDEFLSAIEASPHGVLLLDATDHITWVSAAAADHFGLDRQRDLQQRVTNLIRQPAFVQYLAAGDFREPVKVPVSRGGQTWLQLHLQVYGDGLKLLQSQDITERERADTMRRDFVANVSHEIRTPLTVLNGFIETLGALPLTEVERKRVIGLMAQQAERMQGLVADLLTLAQIEGSPRPASGRWVRVAALLQRIETDARGLSRERHPITVLFEPSEQATEVSGIESEWLSAMGNLVSNAVRYTPAGQPIEVRWARLPDGAGEFSVRDHGIGIDAEHIPRLTERFYRVDGSRSRDTGGTGLGLSIVKHVVQRHGGELKITSEKGKGSVFTLHVPAVRVRRA
ncbi:phosphate regulon sensor histidine kinase PhoR [Aquabacterium sp.]|uniref:phosphate regulon sensor histidine kinase PhoR n=1 Tax=Aquabacterium sp. TaxID=1872578 RepID=UPI0035C6DB6E